MRIAIVGGGVSGLVTAYLLQDRHEIVLFEAAGRVGGHADTHAVNQAGRQYDVDTGFVVFNVRNYPNFVRLLDRLRVESQPTSMSFSVRDENDGFEYCGNTLNTYFAQRRNLFRPSHYRMLADILRFNREATRLTEQRPEATLGDLLATGGFGQDVIDRYLIPMGSAVWSTDPSRMLDFPARFLIRFFDNHGMLDVREQPDWRVIRGGSARYVEALTASYASKIRLNSPVTSVCRRSDQTVIVKPLTGEPETFDHVVLATHADLSLRILTDATDLERELLQAFPFQSNETVLHTDPGLLPRRRRAWASWNYHIPETPQDTVAATYNMNRLQNLTSPYPFCTTLNRTQAIAPNRVLKVRDYAHPVFTSASVAAQQRHHEISGPRRTHFCGAYWGNGFHEDGVNSALAVCRHFGASL